jgi:hypothetical protein
MAILMIGECAIGSENNLKLLVNIDTARRKSLSSLIDCFGQIRLNDSLLRNIQVKKDLGSRAVNL